MDADQLWKNVRRRLDDQVSDRDRACWLDAFAPREVRDATLFGEVPSELHAEQIRVRLGVQIAAALREAGCDGWNLSLAVRAASEERPRASAPVRLAPAFARELTFESFVIGESNEVAYRAAREVAARPGDRFNPFFLFGGVGLGKTHLLTAIANAIAARGTTSRLRMLTGEQFTNELIRSLRADRIESFRSSFRDVDLWIVDDVQFLAGKERTQEEFFHTFDTLRARGRQIVLASDQPPRDIPNLEARLRSRFESGSIQDVRRPDRALRRAIFARKAREAGVVMADEVVDLVAERIIGSVRELEGALRRLAAVSALDCRPLDAARALEILQPLLRPLPMPTIPDVQRLVALRFHVRETDLVSGRRASAFVVPRQVAMYLSRRRTRATFAEIAAGFGGRNHTTVISAVKAVEERKRQEGPFARLLDTLENELRESD